MSAYTALARRWRPQRFEDYVGQEAVVRALTHALDSGRVHHAFLFTGTRGVGKTTVARLLAKCLNCERGVSSRPCGECAACRGIAEGNFVDLIEVDAASRTRVDETRDLLDNVQYAPSQGRYKIYLIDEVHMLSAHSFNALLKTLEEPPPHVKFLLATTDPHRLPVTILSRCLQFNLRRLVPGQIQERMAHILSEEGIPGEEGALRLLARAADGSLRDALSLLDQAIIHGGGQVATLAVAEMLGQADRETVYRLLEALAADDGAALFRQLDDLLALGQDPAAVLDGAITALHRVALAQMLGAAGEEDGIERVQGLAARWDPLEIQILYQMLLHSRRDLALYPDPRLALEMALLRLVAYRRAGAKGGRMAEAATVYEVREGLSSAPPSGEMDWGELIGRLDLSQFARAALAHGTALELSRERVRIALEPGQMVMGERLRAELEAALTAHFGARPQISFHALAEGQGQSLVQSRAVADRERRMSAHADAEADPLVQELRSRLSAEIAEVTPVPERQ